MDIIQELEDLKRYIAGLARTDMEFCTLPPQHGFSSSATVEQVLSKIDLIENKIKENSHKNISINCVALKEFIKSYVSAEGPCTDKFINGLYHYIDLINTEITLLKDNTIRPKIVNLLQKLSSKQK